MDNAELYHHGTKGMKWGRRLYQNKDGSLTPLGRIRYRDPKARAEIKRQATVEAKKQATKTAAEEKAEIEAKRAKLLKSSDAAELYKNKDLLSTEEINERINRINTEKRLKDLVPETKSKGQAFVEGIKKFSGTANELYKLTDTPIGKALKKKLGLEKGEETKKFNLEKVYKNLDKLSDQEIKDAASRVENMGKIRKEYENRNKSSSQNNDSSSSNNSQQNTNKKKADIDKLSKSLGSKLKNDPDDAFTSTRETTKSSNAEKKKKSKEKTEFVDAELVDTGNEFVNKALSTLGSKAKVTESTRSSILEATPDMWKETGSEIVSDIGPELVENIRIGRDYWRKYLEENS